MLQISETLGLSSGFGEPTQLADFLLWPPEISVNDAIKDKSAVVAFSPEWLGQAKSKHSVHLSNQPRQFAGFLQAPRSNDDSVGQKRSHNGWLIAAIWRCFLLHFQQLAAMWEQQDILLGVPKSSVVALITLAVKRFNGMDFKCGWNASSS